jgi:ATP-dependent RNA helicase SUPV3L1/SUV3
MQDVLNALGYRGRPEVQPDGSTLLLFKPRNRGPKPAERERRAEKPRREFKQRHEGHRRGKPQERGESPASVQASEGEGSKPTPQHSTGDRQHRHKPKHQAKHQPKHPPKHEPRREPRPQREVRIDPNSPFAKLAILKNKT